MIHYAIFLAAEDRAALADVIPADFWREIRQAGLVNPDAPLPVAG